MLKILETLTPVNTHKNFLHFSQFEQLQTVMLF